MAMTSSIVLKRYQSHLHNWKLNNVDCNLMKSLKYTLYLYFNNIIMIVGYHLLM